MIFESGLGSNRIARKGHNLINTRWLRFAVLVLAAIAGPRPALADGPWDGHDFAFCFVTDDGTRCNLAWADTARVMNFRFSIAVNVRAGAPASTKLTKQEIRDLAQDGFEIAQHGASHGMTGLSAMCGSPPRGSWMGYFMCTDPGQAERMMALKAEIERDTLANNCGLPASSIKVCAYPMHRHGKALIDSLRAEGFIGARTGGLWDYSSNSYGDFTTMASNSWDGGISLYRIPLANADTWIFGNHSAVPPVHRTYESFLSIAQPIMDQFRASKGICVVYTHHLGDDDDSMGNINYGSGGMTKRDLAWIIDLARANGAKIMTLGDAISYYRARSHMVDVGGDLVWVPGASAAEAPHLANLANLDVFPNPFNPRTAVAFDLASGSHVRTTIHDLRGQLVTILDDHDLEPGHHELIWDGRDSGGRSMPAGTYLLRVDAGTAAESRRMVLLK